MTLAGALLLTVSLTAPNVEGLLTSCINTPLPVRPNCAWLNKLKNSALNFSAYASLRRKFLKIEKSVFTKRGPERGAREMFPSSPAGACVKAHGLNQYWLL